MKISVAMCTYNGVPHLREQLESIASQDRLPDELVIVDDCSSDSTRQVIREFAGPTAFPVDLHENDQNIGSTRSFNRAIANCTGDIIALCDQDDVWKPEKLSVIENFFKSHPETGLVFSDAEIVETDLKPTGKSLWEAVGFDEQHRKEIRDGRPLNVLLSGYTVTGATLAFRSSFVPLVTPFPQAGNLIHDGWIALVIAAMAPVGYVDQRLILYRQHDRQQVGAPRRKLDRRALDNGLIAERLQVANNYDYLIENLEVLLTRLADSKHASELQERLKHLKARKDLGQGLTKRLKTVWAELASARYHSFSNGFNSAAKDLLRGNR